MAKVEKCTSCGNFFNAAIYSNCPYCSKSGEQADTQRASAKKKHSSSGLFRRISSRIRSSVTPASEPEKKETLCTEITEESFETRGVFLAQDQEKQLSSEAVPERNEKPTEPEPSLEAELIKASRTVGKYISSKDGTAVAPVVGWLVGVKGDNYGRSFQLKSGKNRVGRSHKMDVKLMNDESVSRTCVAVVVYDPRTEEFSVLSGESDSLCYLNGSAVYGRELLHSFDCLEFGDSGLNQYLFVPLCGERFRWKPIQTESGRT